MDNDVVSLLIYLALALIGVIGSAYKNKAKRQQQNASRPHTPEVPKTFTANPPKNFETDLGPLMELFDIPKPKQQQYEYETIENGPTAEEAGMKVESQEASAELAGLEVGNTDVIDKNVSEIETFEEGQSDIQKMIAKYEAIRKKQEEDGGYENEISKGEIVSVEVDQEMKSKSDVNKNELFDIKKAIIYSEILKRREY